MDKINEVTSECFIALSQLRELDGGSIAPQAVHARLKGFIEALRARAREQGQSGREADDIAYAIVALADEVAMGKPEPLRGYWMSQPLQLVFFNETLAGEGFFTRLAEIRRDPRRADTLRVYYQCLLFGFQGKYSIRGGDLELMRLIDSIRPEVERNVEPPDSLSPAGEPPDEPLVRASRNNLFLYLALGMFAASIAVFVGLKISLSHQIAELAARVAELSH
ncbi:MAG TPA: DotU family type IV/VI secretion system protein [Polyangia bacterium]|nr:DotU family type IV/VI secretion system protein [Polyangia bacterium]